MCGNSFNLFKITVGNDSIQRSIFDLLYILYFSSTWYEIWATFLPYSWNNSDTWCAVWALHINWEFSFSFRCFARVHFLMKVLRASKKISQVKFKWIWDIQISAFNTFSTQNGNFPSTKWAIVCERKRKWNMNWWEHFEFVWPLSFVYK